MRAQVRTSVQQRDDGSTFGVSPLEDLLALQQQRLSILLFHQLAEGDAIFQAFAESIIRGLGQNFHSAEVPE